MLGGLYGLNFAQHSYLLFAQSVPSVAAGLGLFYFDAALLTLIIIQLTYVFVPLLYIRLMSKEREIQAYFINELRGRQEQIKRGFSLFSSAFGMVLLSLIFTYFWEDQIMDYMRLPLSENTYFIAMFILILFNPFLEECYWRLFLMKTYKETEKYRLLINGSYAIFHFVLLYKIFRQEFELTLGFATYFMSIGGSFEHIREKYGLITCLMAHYGMTLAASLALLVVYKSQQS